MTHSTRRTAVRTAGCAAGVVLVSAVLSGCSAADDGGSSKQSKPAPSPTASSREEGGPEHIPGESVSQAPRPAEGRPLAEIAAAKGNRNVSLGRIARGPMSVLVNCQGKGTLKVTVQPMNMGFPLECVDGKVSSTYNELGLERPRPEGTVTVAAPSAVRWSLTVGQ